MASSSSVDAQVTESSLVQLLHSNGSPRQYYHDKAAYSKEIASAVLTTVLAAHGKSTWSFLDTKGDTAGGLFEKGRVGVDGLQAMYHSIQSYLKTQGAQYLLPDHRSTLDDILITIQLHWQDQRNRPDKYRHYGSLGDGSFLSEFARSLRTSLEEARVGMPLSICLSEAQHKRQTGSLTARGLPCLHGENFTSTADGKVADHPFWKEANAEGAAALVQAVQTGSGGLAY